MNVAFLTVLVKTNTSASVRTNIENLNKIVRNAEETLGSPGFENELIRKQAIQPATETIIALVSRSLALLKAQQIAQERTVGSISFSTGVESVEMEALNNLQARVDTLGLRLQVPGHDMAMLP